MYIQLSDSSIQLHIALIVLLGWTGTRVCHKNQEHWQRYSNYTVVHIKLSYSYDVSQPEGRKMLPILAPLRKKQLITSVWRQLMARSSGLMPLMSSCSMWAPRSIRHWTWMPAMCSQLYMIKLNAVRYQINTEYRPTDRLPEDTIFYNVGDLRFESFHVHAEQIGLIISQWWMTQMCQKSSRNNSVLFISVHSTVSLNDFADLPLYLSLPVSNQTLAKIMAVNAC